MEEEEGNAPLFCSPIVGKAEYGHRWNKCSNSVEKHLEGTDHFVVAVEMRPGGKVVVEVDNDHAITLQELADLNKAVREDLGPRRDELEFQFSSPGMGRPFKVMRQYQKHTGRLVQGGLWPMGAPWKASWSISTDANVGPAHPTSQQSERAFAQAGRGVSRCIPFEEIKSTKASITFN